MLGSGGFSRVYRATQLDLERHVAIKILQPPVNITSVNAVAERDEKLRALMSRFEREAKMVSKLKCPHTITMYDYGQTEDGQLFMSLEFVDGLTLTDLLKKEGALEPDRVAKIMRQVLMSLYEAHQYGMLHRDIKPQNIMVYEHFGMKDQVKLLDFGIVKLIGREASKDFTDLTSDDTLVGTPRYMSPEYIRGDDIIQASDIYSLGLVMYELLVGEQAIQANSSIQIIGKQLERESFYLPQNLNHIDTALHAIINGMVEKDTSLRYSSTQQILDDLEARDRDRHTIPPNAPKLLAASPASVGFEPTDRIPNAHRQTMPGQGSNSPTLSLEDLPEPALYQSHTSAGKRNVAIVGGIGAIALLAIVGIAAMAFSNSTAQSETKPDTTQENTTEIAAVTDTAPETSPAEDTEDKGNEVAVKEAQTFTISSTPAGATLLINNKNHGSTPASLSSDEITFPADIKVEHEGRTATDRLDSPEDLEIELPEKPKVEKKPVKSTKKTTKKKAREPKKVEEKPKVTEKTKPVAKPKVEKKPKSGNGLQGLPTLDP